MLKFTPITLLAILGLISVTALAQTERPAGLVNSEFSLKYNGLAKGRLAFAYEIAGQSDIYAYDLATQNAYPLAADPSLNESEPSWSPDGQKVVFQAAPLDSGISNIFVADSDGRNVRQLTSRAAQSLSPAWSLDGQSIIFSSAQNGGLSLFSVSIENGNVEPFIIKKKNASISLSSPSYSPRGGTVIFASTEYWPGSDIVLYHLKTKKLTIVTAGYQDFLYPSWHPDGGSFVASYAQGEDLDIWNFRKGDANPMRLFKKEGRDVDPIWSDDGEVLFFSGESSVGKEDFQLYAWGAKDGKLSKISDAPGSLRFPSWTPFPTLDQLFEEERLKENK